MKSKAVNRVASLKKLRKADDAAALAQQIVDAIEIDFQSIPDQIEPALLNAALAGVGDGAIQLQIQGTDLISPANKAAKAWAKNRAAELVGMTYNDDGNLVTSSDTDYAISEFTRDEVKRIVSEGFGTETPITTIIDNLQDAAAFSEERATVIAKTEVSRAQAQGNVTIWKQTGLVKSVEWVYSEDEGTCEECEGNEDDGPIPLGETI